MTILKVNNHPATKSFEGLFNDLFGNFENALANTWNNSSVPTNITESDIAYQIEIAAPGRKKENFKVRIEKDIVVISYEGKEAESDIKAVKKIRNEFSINNFTRTFSIDEKIDQEKIEAKYEDGLLKVLIPKKQFSVPTSTEISVN